MSEYQQYHAMLAELRATNSNKAKTEILRRYAGDPAVRTLLRLAYDPYRPYYLGEAKLREAGGLEPATTATADRPVAELAALTQRLTERALSGTAAVEAVREFLAAHTPHTAAEIARVLMKDVGAGITAKTVNAACADQYEPIPTFNIQLAHPVGKKLHDLQYPVQCEYKYDGERVIVDASADARAGVYVPYSREGRVQTHNEGVWAEAVAAVARYLDHDSFVLDAEVVSESFQAVAKSKGRGADRSGLRLVVFDILSGEEWRDRQCWLTQCERTEIIQSMLQHCPIAPLTLPVLRVCHSLAELEEFYEAATASGHEGIMIKDPNGRYEYKRSRSWLKYKPVNTADGRIVSLNAGKVGGRWEGRYGSYTVRGQLEDGEEYEVNVGSGLPHAVLEDINARPDAYLQHHVELKYDCATRAEDSPLASLRFPRHHRLRPDLD